MTTTVDRVREFLPLPSTWHVRIMIDGVDHGSTLLTATEATIEAKASAWVENGSWPDGAADATVEIRPAFDETMSGDWPAPRLIDVRVGEAQ